MGGVPADLDLRPSIGAHLDGILLGKWQLQLHFTRPEIRIGPDLGLSIEGYGHCATLGAS